MPNMEEKNKSGKPGDPAREERDKNNALWAGIIFFMLLIIILWVMNLGMVFKRVPATSSDLLEVDKFSRDFQQAFDQVGAKMGELKNIDSATLQEYAAEFPATTTVATTTVKK
jgi:hypothetical protein